MVIDGCYQWLCMVIDGCYRWLCMVINGYAWLLMVIYVCGVIIACCEEEVNVYGNDRY